MKYMLCPRCGVEMVLSKAIKPKSQQDVRFMMKPNPTLKSNELELMYCLKCPLCGHSDDMK